MRTKLPWLCAALLGIAGWLIGLSMNAGPGGLGATVGSTSTRGGATSPADHETVGTVEDFEQSAAAVLADNNPLRQGHRLFEMIDRLSAAEIPGALNAAMHLNQRKGRRLVRGLIFRWMEFDPRAAVQYTSALPNDQLYSQLRSDALQMWAGKDFDAASQHALTLAPGNERQNALGDAAFALAKTDPIRALKFFEEHVMVPSSQGTPVPTNLLVRIVSQLSLNDFDAAMNYALTIKNFETRKDVLQNLSFSKTNKSPQDLLMWAKKIPDLEARDRITNKAIQAWLRTDPQAMLEHAGALPPGKVQEDAVSQALGQMALSNPQAAAAAALKLAGGAQASAVASVAGKWAQYDPPAATAWADSLPEGETRAGAFSNIIQSWHHEANAAVEKWLRTLPGGGSRDSAVRAFSDRIFWRDPESAAQWASTISDEGNRRNALESVARNWIKRDKVAASAWIQTTNLLPDNVRHQLLGVGE